MFFAAFVQAQAFVRSLLQNAGQLYTNSLFLGNLFRFLAREAEPPHVASPSRLATPRLRRGIRFEGIDFSYPGSPTKALANFCVSTCRPAGRQPSSAQAVQAKRLLSSFCVASTSLTAAGFG
jgi:ATP-binding cassette, subfamily B, bacterial